MKNIIRTLFLICSLFCILLAVSWVHISHLQHKAVINSHKTLSIVERLELRDNKMQAAFLEKKRISPALFTFSYPGEIEIASLTKAYEHRIHKIKIDDNKQWALKIDDQWFNWAHGRILPREIRDQWKDYSRFFFYNYQKGPLVISEVDEETASRLHNRLNEQNENPIGRHPGFTDALYSISNQREAENLVKRITFLNQSTRVHPKIIEPLNRIETIILEKAEFDADVKYFINNILNVGGFSWREIGGTTSRSYHSYGIAVDLIPRSYKGTFGYWRWAAETGEEEWWAVPKEQRFHVPQAIIDTFEENNFVWGGKWLFYDPIHFEYRPEVFILK